MFGNSYKVEATEFAKLDSKAKGRSGSLCKLFAETGNPKMKEYSQWWLRNQGGGGGDCAAFVNGNFIDEWGMPIDVIAYGVRPAIKLRLNS